MRSLPAPTERSEHRRAESTGRRKRADRCSRPPAARRCHRPKIGDVDGIYSDLLLHDMGPALSDSGSYYGISEPDSSNERREEAGMANAATLGIPRLGAVSARRPCEEPGRSGRVPRRRGSKLGEKVLQATPRRATPSPGVPPITGAADRRIAVNRSAVRSRGNGWKMMCPRSF